MANPQALSLPATGEREFFQVMNRLAVALRASDIDGPAKAIYFDALSGLSPAAVSEAARDFAQEPGRKFFPTTAEWWERAHELDRAQERKHLARDNRTEPWRDECADCHDTGFLHDLRCSGKGECGMVNCEKHARHGYPIAAHTYATPCGCRPSNRTYQRMVAAAQQSSAQAKKGSH